MPRLTFYRDQPRAEVTVRRRRAVAGSLWLAAPASWLGRAFIVGTDGPDPLPLELAALAISTALLLVSAVALSRRPALARALGLAGLVGVIGALAFHAGAAPHAAFVTLTGAGLLGFGLVTTEPERDPPIARTSYGHVWSRAVLITALLALAASALAVAEGIADAISLRSYTAALLGSASLLALAAERDLRRARLLSPARFYALAAATTVGAVTSLFEWWGHTILAARLVYAVYWSLRQRRLTTDLVGLARFRPAPFAFASFGGAALVGAMVLALPVSTEGEGTVRIIDALFTATSAVCVTGLTVIDTGTTFSRFGQAVLLLLIQAGGLGIMTLSAMISLAVGRTLTSGAEHALGETIAASDTPAAVLRTVRAIAIGTVTIEATGAALIYSFIRPRMESSAEAAWSAVFHAVSAFCNAGFALQSNSLVPFADDPRVLWVISILIILGGTGFGVMAGSAVALRHVVRRQIDRWLARPQSAPPPPLDLNLRLVLVANAVLLTAGFLAFLTLEWDNALAPLSTGDKLHNAWFQSVTWRTAGFNSVPFEVLERPTVLVGIVLMFVGASPGSTGGGIKTTTAAVLVLSLRNVFDRRPDAEAFGRRIAPEVVHRAAAVMLLSGGALFAGTFLLLLTQRAPFEVLLFEAASALGTVGLTIGGTAVLDDTGKVIVMLLMFLGRVGPLTAAAMLERRSAARHRLPRGEVIVG